MKDNQQVGPGGLTIEARMESLGRQAAEDIKECANVCDTFSKKKLVVKVLKALVWEAQLAEFVGRFHVLKSEFKLALAIHTATTVDGVRETVLHLDEKYTNHFRERYRFLTAFSQLL